MKCSTQDIFKLLENYIEVPDLKIAQILAVLVAEVFNNTRRWELKCHTPYELLPAEQKRSHPDTAIKSPPVNAANVYNIRTGAKIGRNDPCRCSGKKYKKCCGT
jgi:uncharacterized protein YecA (UPF0149 family)